MASTENLSPLKSQRSSLTGDLYRAVLAFRREEYRAVGIVVGVVVILSVVILIIIVDRSPFAFAKVDEVVPLMIQYRRGFGL